MTTPASGPRLGRMLTAMATAFRDDGSVDLDATARAGGGFGSTGLT